MVTMAGNRAASVAMRNAILSGVPKAWWQDIFAEVRKFISGDAKRTGELRTKALAAFATLEVKESEVLALLNRKTVAEIDSDDVVLLRSLFQEIKAGEKKVDNVFRAPKPAESGQQTDAVPETRVDDRTGLAGDAGEPETAERPADAKPDAKPQGKRGPRAVVKDEPPPQGTASPAAEAAAGDLQRALETPAASMNDAGESTLPIDDKTPVLTGDTFGVKAEDGTLLWDGSDGRFVMQWQRGQWFPFADQEAGKNRVVLHLRKTISRALQAKKLDRDAAMAEVAKVLRLPQVPQVLNELSVPQMVEAIAKLHA
jgi:hypothetical protein